MCRRCQRHKLLHAKCGMLCMDLLPEQCIIQGAEAKQGWLAFTCILWAPVTCTAAEGQGCVKPPAEHHHHVHIRPPAAAQPGSKLMLCAHCCRRAEENGARGEPLGLDRRFNRYWRFCSMPGIPNDPSAGRLFFEDARDGTLQARGDMICAWVLRWGACYRHLAAMRIS